MKKQLLFIAILLSSYVAYAQNSIGSIEDFRSSLDQIVIPTNDSPLKSRRTKKTETSSALKISKTESLSVEHKCKSGRDILIGKCEKGTFVISVNDSIVEGHLIQGKKAYKYFSKESQVFVEETDINSLLCVDYGSQTEDFHDHSHEHNEIEGEISEILVSDSNPIDQLQSYPGANGVVLLDFDGELVFDTWWEGGDTIDAAPSVLSDSGIRDVFSYIAEDFAPFNVNITTDESVYNQYPINRRVRCIFTPTEDAYPGAGGVAYLRSFRNTTIDNPCWVFNSGVNSAGVAGSHEIGHTLGLYHDGTFDGTTARGYFSGHNDWGPIMGTPYYKKIGHWSIGEYLHADNSDEDDIAIIASDINGLGFRTDDHSDSRTTGTATQIMTDVDGNILSDNLLNQGLIEQRTDEDNFFFNTQGGELDITVNVPEFTNLDAKISLYDENGTLVTSSDGVDVASSSILINLTTAGVYYISIDGVGYGDPLTDGYSDYSSLGQYYLSGVIPSGEPFVDCNGDEFGTALIDECGICSGGNTGIEPSSASIWYADNDGDGLGDPADTVYTCDPPVGYVSNQDDLCPDDNTNLCDAVTDICNDIDIYSSTTIYSIPGTQVVYDSKVFENKWYTQGNPPSDSNSPWEVVAFCAGVGLDCANISAYSVSAIYSSPNTEVEYGGSIYKNKWYTQGATPGQDQVWEFVGPCIESTISTPEALSSVSDNDIKIFPNPVQNFINLEIPDLESSARVFIVDAFQSSKVNQTVYQKNVQINVSHLQVGYHVLQVVSAEGTKSVQFYKE